MDFIRRQRGRAENPGYGLIVKVFCNIDLICCDLLIEAVSFSEVLNEQLQTFSNNAED